HHQPARHDRPHRRSREHRSATRCAHDDAGARMSALYAGRCSCPSVAASIGTGEDHTGMGEVNPEESLEIGPGVFKRLGDCTGSELESAIRLIAQRHIDRAWIAEQGAGPDRGELNIARRFFANTSDTERDLIAYWQMVKLVEE